MTVVLTHLSPAPLSGVLDPLNERCVRGNVGMGKVTIRLKGSCLGCVKMKRCGDER